MRSVLCAAAVLLAIPAVADDKPPVRELDAKNVKFAPADRGELADQLTEIKTADELAKSAAFANDASRDAIKKQVDFSKEKVVVFAWWGRTPSSVRTKFARDGKTVVFSVATAELAFADLRGQVSVFAVPKDVPVAGPLQNLIDLLKDPVQLSLKDVTIDFEKGGYEPKPLEIKSADELAKADVFADEASRAAIRKQVDFSKDKLVVFVWGGSRGDKFGAVAGRDGKSAVFTYAAGVTDDLRRYAYVFAVPKDWDVKVVK